MIDYEAKNWTDVVFRLRGSVLPRLFPRILVAAGFGAFAAWLFVTRGVKFPPIAHTLIGVALGLLLVFRTNASYDRYWEGRRLLGAMVNRTRDLTRQFATLIEGADAATVAERRELRRLAAAFYAVSALGLQKETDLDKLAGHLHEDERAQLASRAARGPIVLGWISQRLVALARAGKVTEPRLQLLDANLTALMDALGGAERIVKTPIPFAYAQHIKTFVVLFCLTAPFAMAESMRWYTPIAAALLAFALYGIDEIGVEIEDPFGDDPNDLPMDRIGATIDGQTLEMLDALAPAARGVAEDERAA
jgi:putative membrane protein